MWICEQHGEQIPQHNGASYRCPLCTARVVWRDAGPESAPNEAVASYINDERADIEARAEMGGEV